MTKTLTRAEARQWVKHFTPAQIKRLIQLMEAMTSTEREKEEQP